MSVYDFGGIYDYLEDIHFPTGAAGRFPPWTSQPWYYWLMDQQPTEFSFLGQTWGPGWVCQDTFSVIKILAVDSQRIVPIGRVGAATLEAAADRYWQTWDQGVENRRAPEFFGRIDFSNKFFWQLLGRKFPSWATGLKGLAKSKPNDSNPPIGPYITKAVEDYFTRWNNDSNAYNAHSNAIPADGEWNPLTTHSFAVPFPHPTRFEGGNFRGLGKQISSGQAWFGPIPDSAWLRILIILTQSYAFTYGFGQLDPFKWDLNIWPPRRTTLKIIDGGSGSPPSAISNRWDGVDPFLPFIDHQITLHA